MKKFRYLIIFLISLLLLSACGSPGKEKKDHVISKNPSSKTEFLMGTVVTIRIYDKGQEEVLDTVFKRIQTLANKITVNEEDSESEVEKINANAGIEPVKVSDDIFTLIKVGKNYSERANGSFDITVGPLTSLWRIGFPDARKPSQSEIDAVLPLINYEKIQLNEKDSTVFLQDKGMQLDLGAIAKGFITDEVVKVLKEHNIQSAIVDLGGNIFVHGKNPSGNKWGVGIQDPFSARGEVIGKMDFANKSIVTSGIYERYLEVDGKTYHHILNPNDGYPFDNDIAGVSVVTDHSIDGDSLSTLLFSKGVIDGLAFVEKLDNVEAIFVTRDKKVYLSSGLKGKFELTNDKFTIVNE